MSDAGSKDDLTALHALYRALVDAAPIGLGITDAEGEFLVWNPAMMAVSGFSPEEQERWNEARHTEEARAQRKRLLEVAWREGLVARDVSFPGQDGSVRNAVVTAQPTNVAGERCLHVTMQDVTELKRVEEALRESELRFRQVAETLNQVFYLTTPDHRQVFYVSPAYEAQWGRTPASLYERPESWMEAIHPDDRERIMAEVAAGPVDGKYIVEYRIVRPDGSIRWISDNAIVINDDDGQPYRLVGSAEDITDRRRLEEQLSEAHKMEALGRLAGGVAHDFNNVLTAILCNVAMLMKRPADGNAHRERLEEVRLAAERAAGLTKNLLGFSRRAVLTLGPVDLRATVQETATILRHTLDPRVSLLIDEPEEPVTVLADAGEMMQVLLNLCLNARDAMPEGGFLVIRARLCSVTDEHARLVVDAHPGEAVRLSVEDNGHGIAPEVRGRIFEPFFTTKTAGAGTGLGLARVFGIVKQHQGWVEFSSEVGRGTRFDVYLPHYQGPIVEAAVPPPPPSRGSAQRETILFVDDEAPLRKVADAILAEQGYRVILAEDGAEALAIFERDWRSIDLVVLDLRMPHLSGRDTLQAMLRIHPGVRVLVSSGHAAEHEHIEQLGDVAGSLRKPYGLNELTRAVRAALGEESAA